MAQGDDIRDQRVDVGFTETLDVEPYFTDPNGDRLTYRVLIAPGNRPGENSLAATVTVSGSGTVTMIGIQAGTVRWRVEATDTDGPPAHKDFNIIVDVTN